MCKVTTYPSVCKYSIGRVSAPLCDFSASTSFAVPRTAPGSTPRPLSVPASIPSDVRWARASAAVTAYRCGMLQAARRVDRVPGGTQDPADFADPILDRVTQVAAWVAFVGAIVLAGRVVAWLCR